MSRTSDTLERIRELVYRREVQISDHGYDELAQDGILAREAVSGVQDAELVEDYPDYAKGPCVLALQEDGSGQAIHIVWGIPKGKSSPAVLVTAYRPDPAKWSADFRRRRV